MKATRTTSGQPLLLEGKIVIRFGLLNDQDVLTQLCVDVDAYAIELIRGLAAAISQQRDSEGIV